MTDKQTKLYVELRETRKRLLPVLAANASDPLKDKNGSSTNVYAASLRFIGIADFLLDGDVRSFRERLSMAAKLRVRIFERFNDREPIGHSYVSTLAYKELFDALAACDTDTATLLATHLGGRPEIEKEQAHPFDSAMGYALKAAVLGKNQTPANETLASVLKDGEHANFRGYGIILEQLESPGCPLSIDALAAIVAGHKAEARAGVFKGMPDEFICVWGIGLVNLARAHRHIVDFCDDLMPAELIT